MLSQIRRDLGAMRPKAMRRSTGGRAHARKSAHTVPGRSQPTRRPRPARVIRHHAGNLQNLHSSYERYLCLARAEALRGDRIVAENYFQHAEHYFRAMRECQS